MRQTRPIFCEILAYSPRCDCYKVLARRFMKIGIKSWNEELSEVLWEMAAVLGCIFVIVGVIALGIMVIYIRHPK
jgi:hypothetical protein